MKAGKIVTVLQPGNAYGRVGIVKHVGGNNKVTVVLDTMPVEFMGAAVRVPSDIMVMDCGHAMPSTVVPHSKRQPATV